MQNPQNVKLAVESARQLIREGNFNRPIPKVGLILGTGLSGMEFFNAGATELKIPFSAITGFPVPSVASHAGEYIFSSINGIPVVAQLGRCHLYEGRTVGEVCMGVRLMAGLGIRILVITNAAGALNPLFEPGSLMRMCDYINFTGQSPLMGENCEAWGERFPDMSAPFDATLGRIAQKCALHLGIRLEEGVYIGVRGPEMETAAETRMYRQWGADAIGMSTVLEVIAARHLGLRVLGLSCLTNRNLPDCMRPAPFAEIVEKAEIAGKNLALLIPEMLPLLAQAADADQSKVIAARLPHASKMES